jgi:hypothetical protein
MLEMLKQCKYINNIFFRFSLFFYFYFIKKLLKNFTKKLGDNNENSYLIVAATMILMIRL